MRKLRTVVFVSLFASIGAGCAAIAGLGDLEEVACDAGCDGGGLPDVTSSDAPMSGDTITADSPAFHDSAGDALGPDSTGDDASSPDSSADSSASDAMDADASTDADATSDDAADAATPPDSGVDSGCGSLDTTTNCGACGSACSGTHADVVGCNGLSCTYTCSTGYSNCDTSSRNVGGCECATPGCCGSGCQVTHSNGVGQSFYDCNASGTYSEVTANEACVAFVGQANAGNCMDGFYCIGANDASVGDMVCATGTQNTCDCWGYDGMLAGKVEASNGHGTSSNNYANCNCPNPGAAWQ